MKKTLLFLMFLSGCGPSPNYRVYGISVYFDDVPEVPKEQLKLLLDLTFDAFQERKGIDPQDAFMIYHFDMIFQKRKIKSEVCDGHECSGLTTWDSSMGNDKIHLILYQEDCIAYSAVAHEIYHALSYHYYGDGDGKHKDAELFDGAKRQSSAERQVYLESIHSTFLCEHFEYSKT